MGHSTSSVPQAIVVLRLVNFKKNKAQWINSNVWGLSIIISSSIHDTDLIRRFVKFSYFIVYLLSFDAAFLLQHIEIIRQFRDSLTVMQQKEMAIRKRLNDGIRAIIDQRIVSLKEIIHLLKQRAKACTKAINMILYHLSIMHSWSRVKVSHTFHQVFVHIHVGGGVSTSVASHERVRCRMMDAWHGDLRQCLFLD